MPSFANNSKHPTCTPASIVTFRPRSSSRTSGPEKCIAKSTCPEAIASLKRGPESVTIYSTCVMPSAASSSSTTYCGMMQRLGLLASLIVVVSGGASSARAARRCALQASPTVAVEAAAKRISRLVENIGASRFGESVAFHADPCPARKNLRDQLFNTTLSDSEWQGRDGICRRPNDLPSKRRGAAGAILQRTSEPRHGESRSGVAIRENLGADVPWIASPMLAMTASILDASLTFAFPLDDNADCCASNFFAR